MQLLIFALSLQPAFAEASDINVNYEACVKRAADDADSARCLDEAAPAMDQALTDVLDQLLTTLRANPSLATKAHLLADAHAKWLPSRDADCLLRAAVTQDTAAEAADAARLCNYQANVPRLNQYRRFLEFAAE